MSTGPGEAEAVQSVSPELWTELRAQILAHRDDLRGDQTLLDTLGLKLTAANVVEFFPAALARLEAAHARELTARQEIEALAKANFKAQAETHSLIIDLLESRNNTDLARRVNQAAQERFGLAGGLIAAEVPDESGSAPAGWKTLPEGLVDMLIGGDRQTRLGPCHAARDLFDDVTAPVQSCALIRISLWNEHQQGMLAFGSADPDGFTADMGPELVAFLANVVERTAARWPGL